MFETIEVKPDPEVTNPNITGYIVTGDFEEMVEWASWFYANISTKIRTAITSVRMKTARIY